MTLGMLGGGQLGRLMLQAAKTLGIKTAALDAAANAPALQIADTPVVGGVDDADAAKRMAEKCDIVTLEWELIPAAVLEAVKKIKPIYPDPSVLAVIRDRLTQKIFLKTNNVPQTPFGEPVSLENLPFPVVVKRRTHGYDGKGQSVVRSAAEIPKAAEVLKAPCVWESLVDFEKEISVILARDRDGVIAVYPVAENIHRNGILHATVAPARVSDETAKKAVALATAIAAKLGHVGVMAVEMFLLKDGTLLINEIAPRVHNSGHYTLGACATSQFEQHVRAVTGMPLGPVTQSAPALMVNLLGDLWTHGEPKWKSLDGVPGLTLHLYGKSEARPGRKMGHYTVVGPAAPAELSRADERLASLR